MSENINIEKKVLLENLNLRFGNLIDLLNKIPLHQKIKDNAFLNLDQAMFWLREGISLLNFDSVPPPATDVPAEEVSQEEKEVSPIDGA